MFWEGQTDVIVLLTHTHTGRLSASVWGCTEVEENKIQAVRFRWEIWSKKRDTCQFSCQLSCQFSSQFSCQLWKHNPLTFTQTHTPHRFKQPLLSNWPIVFCNPEIWKQLISYSNSAQFAHAARKETSKLLHTHIMRSVGRDLEETQKINQTECFHAVSLINTSVQNEILAFLHTAQCTLILHTSVRLIYRQGIF